MSIQMLRDIFNRKKILEEYRTIAKGYNLLIEEFPHLQKKFSNVCSGYFSDSEYEKIQKKRDHVEKQIKSLEKPVLGNIKVCGSLGLEYLDLFVNRQSLMNYLIVANIIE